MAGYQNKNGFSGGQLDNILFDYNYKATPQQISFPIDDEVWPGIESDGLYPDDTTVGSLILDSNTFGEALANVNDPYQPTGLTFTFSFKAQTISAPIQAVVQLKRGEDDETSYLIPFVARDSRSEGDRSYHQYLARITYDGNNFFLHIKAIADLGKNK